MIDKQSKNIIKAVAAVLLSVILGEGILGLGFFWPFLLMLLDWRWVYWLALLLGVLISALYRLPIGQPSLFLVVIVGGMSFFLSKGKESGWVILVVSLVINIVFDKVFGFYWSIWDVVSIVVAWSLAVRGFERTETIKISY